MDTDNKLGEEPHGALFFILAYLPLFELLAISQVCKSVRDALNNDILPWLKTIIVESPLNSRLSDDVLMKITSKANGRVTTLALIDCVNITNGGLLGVIAQNPLINKLHIPNCTGLTPEGVIEAVKTINQCNGSLVSLKIEGIRNINKEHLETLLSLLPTDQTQQMKPNLYHQYKQLTLRGEETNESSIDVEICPRCKKGGVIFDCPRLTCNRRRRRPSLFNRWRYCRGCYGCIPRCEDCGNCVLFGEMCEAACGDIVCNICWLQLPKCDLCNKAYCKQHTDTDRQCNIPGSSRFLCNTCHANFQH